MKTAETMLSRVSNMAISEEGRLPFHNLLKRIQRLVENPFLFRIFVSVFVSLPFYL
jgi:hypothetical protein